MNQRIGDIEVLRACAVLMVAFQHLNGSLTTLDAPSLPWPMLHLGGSFGVDLFFVISGFLIVTLILREKKRTDEISLKHFYTRRFLRIFPAYYLVLLFTGAIAYLRPEGNSATAVKHDLPFALLYIANFVHMQSQLSITWSLSVEEQFYLVVPAVLKPGPGVAGDVV